MTDQDQTQMLSVISEKQWQFVAQENLSAREAVEFLLNGMQVRTFPEILAQVCRNADPEQQLVEGLCRLEPSANADSVRRKVQNWMRGKSIPTDREDVFKICFALRLELEAADHLMTALTEQSIHYRNRTEVVYAYCLKNRLDYHYAHELALQFLPAPENKNNGETPATVIVQRKFQSVHTEEDLFAFILKHRVQPGVHHETAYRYFRKMLKLLTGEELENESQYSMEYVADTYLRLNMPQDKRSAKYTEVQKMVKKYWPSVRSVKAMSSQTEDVSRKTLLLLYLVTGGVWDDDYDELDENYIDAKEYLQTHCKRMNAMLWECGMRRIDPRNVFDYLVLYCMRPEDTVFMSDRMAEVVGELFRS